MVNFVLNVYEKFNFVYVYLWPTPKKKKLAPPLTRCNVSSISKYHFIYRLLTCFSQKKKTIIL